MPKILIIDDDKDYLFILKNLLSTYEPDYEVLTTQSGKEGIKLAEIEKPDVILLDIKMPGMDGYEVCRQLKQDEELKHIPIVFLTGVKTDLQDRIRGLEHGGDAYLHKPVETGELLAQIEVMLRIKKAEDELRLEKESLEKKVHERTKDLEKVITKLKKSEEALIERERFHRGLLDDMVSFVAVLKPDGEVIFVNNTPLKVGGFELEDVVGQKFYNCAWWTHSDEVRQTVKKYIEQCACGETLIHDIQIQTADGSLMWIEYSMHPYFDENGNIKYLIPEGRDITERKKAEEERVQALQEARQASKVKDLFITNMSHEIRTPLNSLLGFTEIIGENFKDRMDEEENEYFQIVNSSGQRLINTVHDILDISRIEAGVFPDNPRVVRLATPIESIFKEFRPVATAKNLKLTYTNQIDDGTVKVDEPSIVKAFSSLVDNAIKYTKEGQIKILLNEQNSKYILSISDTGIGISTDYLNQLYDAFSQESTGYTKKYQGLGLGLSIAKSCLDMNGIPIVVESKQGVGTTFNLTFTPADAVSAEPEIKTVLTDIKTEKTASKEKSVVLLVEDDLHNRKTLEVILKGKYETPYAVSVDEAKKQLQEYAVDLIILDLSLEGDEYGLDLVAYMKANARLKDIPVIAVTAHAFTTDRDNVFKAGCNAYMSKPINIQKLLGMISEYCS